MDPLHACAVHCRTKVLCLIFMSYSLYFYCFVPQSGHFYIFEVIYEITYDINNDGA